MSKRHIEVAVSGPLRQTFTYSVSPQEELHCGQRLLVPFGRSRLTGFYLGDVAGDSRFKIKSIERPLDDISYFSPELFSFCRWVADYYFANPADSLTAALPPGLKGNRPMTYTWGTSDQSLPSDLVPHFRPQRKLESATLSLVKGTTGRLSSLLQRGAIREVWHCLADHRPRTKGYRIADHEVWQKHYADATFSPELFDNVRTRQELLSQGWSDYQMTKARRLGLLTPVIDDSSGFLPFVEPKAGVNEIELTSQQRTVLDGLEPTLVDGFKVTLLHGVTGSGKTLVYCHLCQSVLKAGKAALILVPEIALSGTTLAYFRGFFGDQVAVIHSAMTDRERQESWQGLRQGKYRIAVGPRSALFASMTDLGLLIVDEEHDPSYKQDEPSPRFQGRDAAIMRAKMSDLPVILGSASPSLESYYQAQQGKYRLLEMSERPGPAVLPKVTEVDMRSDRLAGQLPFFSYTLKKQLQTCLESDAQAILFINRRGHTPQLKCAGCGHAPECPSCRVKLTYHRVGRKLTCHYCGHAQYAPDVCPECGGNDMIHLGAGTQRVEQALPLISPEVKVVRFDSDTAGNRRQSHRILSQFGRRDYNLLLGTQMVTKGLDFPGVTLVGVLAADLSMDLPDFRASERAFARLLQVAGRSGRADKPGEVLIQTYYPDSDLIDKVRQQDYLGFYRSEIQLREALRYPPFSRLVQILISGPDDEALQEAISSFRKDMDIRLGSQAVLDEVLGPAPCPMHFLRKRYRRHLLVKTQRARRLVDLLTAWESEQAKFGLPGNVRVSVNVDPSDLM